MIILRCILQNKPASPSKKIYPTPPPPPLEKSRPHRQATQPIVNNLNPVGIN